MNEAIYMRMYNNVFMHVYKSLIPYTLLWIKNNRYWSTSTCIPNYWSVFESLPRVSLSYCIICHYYYYFYDTCTYFIWGSSIFPFLYQSIVPPIFGLDLSPILAFVLLNVLTSATAAVGAEITPNDEKKIKQLLSSQQYNGLRPFPVKPYYNKKTTTATWLWTHES